MSPLDRQIAEAKGWNKPIPEGRAYIGLEDFISACGAWSTSDAKAFELVDELCQPKSDFRFILYRTPNDRWGAEFRALKHEGPIGWGVEDARPEAICRAYLAAVAWMKEKKG